MKRYVSNSFAAILLVAWGITPSATAKDTDACLIGDSTVRWDSSGGLNNSGAGWSDALSAEFDMSQVTLQHKAYGGTNTKTFYHDGFFDSVTKDSKFGGGDYLIMQFGHNDGRSYDNPSRYGTKPPIKRINDTTGQMTCPDGNCGIVTETVHMFGWYLQQFTNQAKRMGVIPIVA